MSTLLWKRVLDPEVLFIEFSDVGGSPQGKVGLLQLVLRHRHLHRDVVGLSELVLGLEVADDEGNQVGGHPLCHTELVPHLLTSNICQARQRVKEKG